MFSYFAFFTESQDMEIAEKRQEFKFVPFSFFKDRQADQIARVQKSSIESSGCHVMVRSS